MAQKKTIVSVVASTVIASTLFSAVQADAASYKVKNGDTLSHIALENETSVSKLKKQNDLDSDLITIGQKISLDKNQSSDSSSESSESSSSSDYKVNSGDTLSGIALKNNTTVSKLKERNNLNSNLITIGQKLTLNKDSSSGHSSESSKSDSSSDNSSDSSNSGNSGDSDEIIDTAKSLEGTPYVWGGATPSGFDSSGFINYVFEQNDVSLSRTHDGMWANDGEEVSNPEPGDVVFFEGTYKSGISHSGIYLGNDQMIHAGTEETGVEVVSPESWNHYWADHYAGAKRF